MISKPYGDYRSYLMTMALAVQLSGIFSCSTTVGSITGLCSEVASFDEATISDIRVVAAPPSFRGVGTRITEERVREFSPFALLIKGSTEKERFIEALDLKSSEVRSMPLNGDTWGVIDFSVWKRREPTQATLDVTTFILIGSRWYEKSSGCSNEISPLLGQMLTFGGEGLEAYGLEID